MSEPTECVPMPAPHPAGGTIGEGAARLLDVRPTLQTCARCGNEGYYYTDVSSDSVPPKADAPKSKPCTHHRQQPLFEHMLDQHDLILLTSEMNEIEDVVKAMQEPSVADRFMAWLEVQSKTGRSISVYKDPAFGICIDYGRSNMVIGDSVAECVAKIVGEGKKKSGIELIAAERRRQVEVEGWTEAHDAAHTFAQLADAAACYALAAADVVQGRKIECIRHFVPSQWPWMNELWKPSADPIDSLVKAGALIAAELDRLQSGKIAGAT